MESGSCPRLGSSLLSFEKLKKAVQRQRLEIIAAICLAIVGAQDENVVINIFKRDVLLVKIASINNMLSTLVFNANGSVG